MLQEQDARERPAYTCVLLHELRALRYQMVRRSVQCKIGRYRTGINSLHRQYEEFELAATLTQANKMGKLTTTANDVDESGPPVLDLT